MTNSMLVYCAGPHYSPEERDAMAHMASLLEKNRFDTYLPHRDGIDSLLRYLQSAPGSLPRDWQDLPDTMNRVVFALETFQIVRRCSLMVLNMNGRVPDEGAVFKASLAFAAGRPITIYKNDNRSVFGGHDNSMVTGLAGGRPVVNRMKHIPAVVKEIVANQTPEPARQEGVGLSPYVLSAAGLGEKVWRLLPEINLTETRQEAVMEQLLSLKNRCEQLNEFQEMAI